MHDKQVTLVNDIDKGTTLDKNSLDELLESSGEEVSNDEVVETSQENETADDAETVETAPAEDEVKTETETDDETQTAETTQDGEESKHTVPLGTLTAERKKAQDRYQAQTEELARERAEFAAYKQQQQTKPLETQEAENQADDSELMFDDPVAYKKKLMDDIRSEIGTEVSAAQKQATLTASYAKAQQDHGADYMNGIMDELREQPDLMEHFSKQADPVGSAVKWKKDKELLGEFGSDAAGYKAKIKAELVEEMRLEAGLQPTTTQQTDDLVPSISDVSGSNRVVTQTIDQASDEVFDEIFG